MRSLVVGLSVILSSSFLIAQTPPERPKLIEVAPVKKPRPGEKPATPAPAPKPAPAPQAAPEPQQPVQPSPPLTQPHSLPENKPAFDTSRKRPVPDRLKDHVRLLPVYTDEDRKDDCMYLFDNRCFLSLNALQKFLLNEIRICKKDESIDVKKTEAKILENDEFKIVTAYEFEGKTFTEQGLYLQLIETYYKACNVKKPEPSDKSMPEKPSEEPSEKPSTPEAPKPAEAPEEDEYGDFANQKHQDIGTLYSKAPVFLRHGTHSRAAQFGPVGRMEFPEGAMNRHPREHYSSQTHTLTKVCMPIDEAMKFAGNSKSVKQDIEAGKFESIIPSLPTDRDGEIDNTTVKIVEKDGKKEICYEMSHGIRYVEGADFAEVAEFYGKAFAKYDGLSQLPEPLLKELKAIWAKGKTLEEKVAAVEQFWRTKVKYLLDDHALYADYFKTHPEANLVRAACEIGQGRCVPKNFGLAVAIHELSGGTVPVRMDSGFSMSRAEEPEGEATKKPATEVARPISTGVGHLGIQVLLQNPKTKLAAWKNVEASIGSETMEQVEQRALESKQIVELIRAKLGDRKLIRVPIKFTQYTTTELSTIASPLVSQDGGEATQVPGASMLNEVKVVKEANPESIVRTLRFEQLPNGDLQMSTEKGLTDFFAADLLPKTTLAEMVGGERYLAAFMGYAEYSNDMSFGRSWKHMGGDRYQDARLLRVYLPDGSHLEEQQVFTFNFGSQNIIESVVGYINGEKSYDALQAE